MCDTLNEEKCETINEEKCDTVTDEVCETETEQKCETIQVSFRYSYYNTATEEVCEGKFPLQLLNNSRYTMHT